MSLREVLLVHWFGAESELEHESGSAVLRKAAS